LAPMGGFVNVGETVEQALRRELQEEMGITLPSQEEVENLEELPRLFGVYSDPRRDSRRHTASAVFVVQAPNDIKPRAADDVKEVELISLKDLDKYSFFADHKTILKDYVQYTRGQNVATSDHAFTKDSLKQDLIRSVCPIHSKNKIND